VTVIEDDEDATQMGSPATKQQARPPSPTPPRLKKTIAPSDSDTDEEPITPKKKRARKRISTSDEDEDVYRPPEEEDGFKGKQGKQAKAKVAPVVTKGAVHSTLPTGFRVLPHPSGDSPSRVRLQLQFSFNSYEGLRAGEPAKAAGRGEWETERSHGRESRR